MARGAPSGIRLRHPDRRTWGRSCTFELRSRPYPSPIFCGRCGREHTVKTYHVQVDSEGIAYVSVEIWQMMQKHNELGGFELADETRGKPPTQMVGLGEPTPLNGRGVIRLEDLRGG